MEWYQIALPTGTGILAIASIINDRRKESKKLSLYTWVITIVTGLLTMTEIYRNDKESQPHVNADQKIHDSLQSLVDTPKIDIYPNPKILDNINPTVFTTSVKDSLVFAFAAYNTGAEAWKLEVNNLLLTRKDDSFAYYRFPTYFCQDELNIGKDGAASLLYTFGVRESREWKSTDTFYWYINIGFSDKRQNLRKSPVNRIYLATGDRLDKQLFVARREHASEIASFLEKRHLWVH